MQACIEQYIGEQISQQIGFKTKGQCKTCWDHNQTKAIYNLQYIKHNHTKAINASPKLHIPHPIITTSWSKMVPYIDYYPLSHQGNPLYEPQNIKQPKWRQTRKCFYKSNKWANQQIRKQLRIKRIIGKHYRKKENKTWKCKLKKRRRSKRRSLIQNTKDDYHLDFAVKKYSEPVPKIKKYKYPNRKKYTYPNRDSKGQTKQRRTCNVKKSSSYSTLIKEIVNVNNRMPIYRNRLLSNVFNKDYNNKGVIKKCTGEYAVKLKHKDFKSKFQISNDSSLIISSSILFTFNGNEINDNKVILTLNKCQIDIFDKLSDLYWTSFVFLPCYKDSNNRYSMRKDLRVKFNIDSLKSELDDNYVFYYISQYCYEARTPYIEYECQITPKLKRPLWTLNSIKQYNIEDLLVNNCDENYLNNVGDIYDVLYEYLGYSSVCAVTVNAYANYTIDNKQTQNELCFMKGYKPQKYINSEIRDEYKQYYNCTSKRAYIRLRGKQYNGCKTFHFEQFYNIPCSCQGAIWGCNYNHYDTNRMIYKSGAAMDGSRAKYYQLDTINIEDQSTMSKDHRLFWW